MLTAAPPGYEQDGRGTSHRAKSPGRSTLRGAFRTVVALPDPVGAPAVRDRTAAARAAPPPHRPRCQRPTTRSPPESCCPAASSCAAGDGPARLVRRDWQHGRPVARRERLGRSRRAADGVRSTEWCCPVMLPCDVALRWNARKIVEPGRTAVRGHRTVDHFPRRPPAAVSTTRASAPRSWASMAAGTPLPQPWPRQSPAPLDLALRELHVRGPPGLCAPVCDNTLHST